jgi:preprotein translocase subunit YajC
MQPNPNTAAVNIVFMLSMVAIWYFLLIRPQQKQQKETRAMIDNLKKNAEVVTNSGIHGTIVNVKDKTFVLRVDENAKIEIDKSAIAYVKKTREKEND